MEEGFGGRIVVAGYESAVDPDFESAGKLRLQIEQAGGIPGDMSVKVSNAGAAVEDRFKIKFSGREILDLPANAHLTTTGEWLGH